MEMQNSRRSTMDRCRDLPGLKKPRLSDDAPDRAINGVNSRVSSSNLRFRANEERGDSIGELVAQYKTALAELTFNSKPIITNLTIIAGENVHAAKMIVATICNNVLEVPIEQKLPSLYLLDSIVKNIGRDYIKHFAASLPEVFCKAFKQVDSSIHPGMRHLFGTWKGVFPPSSLQIIEKELGFPPVVNGSSGTAVSRSDSQTKRPPHSIHVNPKYLEARQRLQQTRAKEIQCDESGDVVTPSDDAEISDRPATSGSTRQGTDISSKMPNIQRSQRELSNDPGYEKKGIRDIKKHQFSSILSRQPDQGGGRISERTKERDELGKSYYGSSGTASDTLINRRNGFDASQSYGNYRASGFGQADHLLPSVHVNMTNKSIHPTPKNWKNSEEEEYMWDDVNSTSTEYGGTNSSIKRGWNIDNADKRAGLQRGPWIPLESDLSDFHRDKLDTSSRLKPSTREDKVPSFRDTDEQYLHSHSQWEADSRRNMEPSADPVSVGQATSGYQASSMWPQREPLLPNQKSKRFSDQPEGGAISFSSGPSNLISSLPGPGVGSHSHPSSPGLSGSSGLFGQQRLQPLQPSSPPSHPLQTFQPLQHQKLHNAVNHDNPQPQFSLMSQKPIQLPGHLNRTALASVTQDSSLSFAENQSQLRHNPPLLHQARSELPLQQAKVQSQPLTHAEKSPTLSQSSETQSQRFSGDASSTNAVDVSGQASTSDLLAAIMKSGLLPNIPTSGLQNFNIQPPLPTGPPPVQALPSSGPSVTPSSPPLQISQDNSPTLTAGVVLPPLPPGPPPSSQKSNASSIFSNPFSSLLSSLVAKGIIASPATEMPAVTSTQMPNESPHQTIEVSSSTTVQIPANSDVSTIPPSLEKGPFASEPFANSDASIIPPSSEKEPFVSKPYTSTGAGSLAPYALELEDLIGIDFKPEIIRELHPLVTSSLFDLKHQCDICGLRFKIQEQLQSHTDLHSSEKSEISNSDELSRKWYSNKNVWVAGNDEPPQMPEPSTFLEVEIPSSEKCEPMVPADESQCICAFCGKPFEDFYSHERDEWMYKGTVYLNSSERVVDRENMDEIKVQVPIVHAKCLSSSSDNKNVAEDNPMVQLYT